MTTLANRTLRAVLRRWLQGLLGDATAVEQVLLAAVPPKGSDIAPGQCAASLFAGAFHAHSAAASSHRQPLARGSFAELAVVQLLAALVTRPDPCDRSTATADDKYLAASHVSTNTNSATTPTKNSTPYRGAPSPASPLFLDRRTSGSASTSNATSAHTPLLSSFFNASTASSFRGTGRRDLSRPGKLPPISARWRSKVSRRTIKATTAPARRPQRHTHSGIPCAPRLTCDDDDDDAALEEHTGTDASTATPNSPRAAASTPPPPRSGANVMDTAATDFELPQAAGPSAAFIASQEATSARPFHSQPDDEDAGADRDSADDSLPTVKQTAMVYGGAVGGSDSDSDDSLLSAVDEDGGASLPCRPQQQNPMAAEDDLGEVNQYVLLELLGRGSQGEVFLAMDTDAGELRALKIVRRPMAGERVTAAKRKVLEDLAHEVAAMKRLRHPNVVALHEVIDDPAAGKMFLALQYVENGPVAHMRPDGTATRTFDPPRLIKLAQQMCAGLAYLHRNGVVHRDVKPENILLGRDDRVFLADFGVAEVFQDTDGNGGRRNRVHGTRGTPAFLAPELLALNISPCGASVTNSAGSAALEHSLCDVAGEPVDVWALGMTLYVLLYGKLPWEFADARDLFDAIQRRPIELRPQAAMAAASLSLAPLVASLAHQRASVASPPSPSPAAPHVSATNPRVSPPSPSPLAAVPDELPIKEFCYFTEPAQQYTDAGSGGPAFSSMVAEESLFGAVRGEMGGSTLRSAGFAAASFASASLRASSDTSPNAPSNAVAASADEGWRRLLAEMLQRDPKRRATLDGVRRCLHVLEQRVQQARSMASRQQAKVNASFSATRQQSASFATDTPK